MVDIMNELGVDAAVYGNHEFDFGIDPLKAALQGMNFPWICSNLRDKSTTEVLATTTNSKGERTGINKIIQNWKTKEGNSLKVGLIGLVEVEWLETLNKVSLDDIIYEDYVTVASRLVAELQEEDCELIIALTHMREPNDVRLARNIDGIHLILGGHDHHYNHQEMSDVHILKSGSEFREFSTIDIKIINGNVIPTFKRHELSQGTILDTV
jgi:5'-nucleotidase